MKIKLLFSLYTLLQVFQSMAQTCDSIRLVLHSHRVDANISWGALSIDTIVDNQVVSSTTNNWDPALQQFIFYQTVQYQWDTIGNQIIRTSGANKIANEYDSTGRLIVQEKAYYNGSFWDTNFRLEKYYTVNNQDSLLLQYSIVNTVYDLYYRITYQYDSIFRIVRKTSESYLNSVFQKTEDILTDYPSNTAGIIRADSVYINYFSGLYLYYVYAYASIGPNGFGYTIFDDPFNIMFPWASYSANIICGDTLWEWGAGHSANWRRGNYNSECLPVHLEEGGGSLSSGVHSMNDDYYYVNCNLMQGFLSAQSKKICQGDTIQLAANVYGGTPPYHYQWSSSHGIINDTISHPNVQPDSTTTYFITVTDSNLNQWTDSVFIQVGRFYPANLEILSVDSTSTCSSAEIIAKGASGAYLSWSFNHHYFPTTSSLDSIIQANYTGWYFLSVYSGVCPVQMDSIELNMLPHPHPYLSVRSGCNEMIASATAPAQFNWYHFNDTIYFYSGDTLDIQSNGNYRAEAMDSLGCPSNRDGYYFEVFSITPSFQNACNDSCMGTASVYVEPSAGRYSYLWSNGDTLYYTDSLCNSPLSVTVTSYNGCQLSASDSCLGVSVQEIFLPDLHRVSVFPNPATSILHLELNNSLLKFPIRWQVSNILGQLTDDRLIFENSIPLDKHSYPTGIYLFQLVQDSKIIGTGKFIIQE